MENNRKMTPPPPPARTNNKTAEELATDFDDLHFFSSKSSPPAMKNFIICASLASSKDSLSSSNSNNSNVSINLSDDFTLGSRNGVASVSTVKRDHHNEPRNNSHDNRHDGRRRSSHPSNTHHSNTYHKSSSKERYVFSNFRFLVKEGSVIPKSIDEPFDWLSIEMVLVPEIEHLLCPICLDVPCVPRFTRCGHIYCLPCLLQFFQTSEASLESLGNNWRSCPVCAEALHLKQLRPVKFCPATEPQAGEMFHSVLVKKCVGSLHPLQPEYPNDTLNTLSPFQRLIPVTRSFVLNQILNPELSFLRLEIKERRSRGEDSLELSFYEAAIKHIEDIKSASAHGTVSTAHGSVSTSNHNTNPSTTEYYHFHQSRDGLNVFLHPLCMKILKNHFDSYESIPATLSLPIVQLEREIVTVGNRKRFKYLDHLSLGTQIILVEVDLKSIVSPAILQSHHRELTSRQGVRDQKLASDTRELSRNGRDRSILEEWKMMEDDYYSISQATAAMDIRVPESVKLDNLDDEASFPLPSSYNNTARSSLKKSPAFTTSGSSPSFSALAHSLNSPFTYSQSYAWNSSNELEESPTLSTTASSSTGKKKIVLFSNGLGNTKK